MEAALYRSNRNCSAATYFVSPLHQNNREMKLNRLKPKHSILASVIVYCFAITGAHAASVIDNFTFFQVAQNGSDGPINITGSDFGNVTRTLTASPASGGDTEIDIESGAVHISNGNGATGSASIFYTFTPIDLTTIADSIAFNIGFIDLSVELQVIANGLALFDFQNFGAGPHSISFSQFTHPDSFKNLNSLQFNFQGTGTWDANIDSLTAQHTPQVTSTVPEPTTLALLAIGLFYLRKPSVKAARIKLN